MFYQTARINVALAAEPVGLIRVLVLNPSSHGPRRTGLFLTRLMEARLKWDLESLEGGSASPTRVTPELLYFFLQHVEHLL